MKDVVVRRPALAPDRRNVYINDVYVGMLVKSSRRWANGWEVVTKDGKDLGDQPRRQDAVNTLVAYVTSPIRRTVGN